MAKGAIRMAKHSASRPARADAALYPAALATGRKYEGEKKAGPVIGARLAPLQQQSAPLRNKIIAALRSAIETGLLVPGQRLIEKCLCQQLSVSRTSLRELQAEGILEYNSSRGLSVSAISIEDAKNIYRLRSALDGFGRRAIHRTGG